jgi:hypothetical protein
MKRFLRKGPLSYPRPSDPHQLKDIPERIQSFPIQSS